MDRQRQPDDEAEAERERRVRACADGAGHDWELELSEPGDDSEIDLSCTRCPATVDDLYPDGHELISMEFDGITVQDSRHDSPVPLVVPVDAEVWTTSYWTECGPEYDAGLLLTPRGPARAVDVGGPACLPERLRIHDGSER